jgi:hypothetical protein
MVEVGEIVTIKQGNDYSRPRCFGSGEASVRVTRTLETSFYGICIGYEEFGYWSFGYNEILKNRHKLPIRKKGYFIGKRKLQI